MGPLQRIKDSFVAGLILVAPLAITLYVLTILVNWSLQFINPWSPRRDWDSGRSVATSSGTSAGRSTSSRLSAPPTRRSSKS